MGSVACNAHLSQNIIGTIPSSTKFFAPAPSPSTTIYNLTNTMIVGLSAGDIVTLDYTCSALGVADSPAVQLSAHQIQ